MSAKLVVGILLLVSIMLAGTGTAEASKPTLMDWEYAGIAQADIVVWSCGDDYSPILLARTTQIAVPISIGNAAMHHYEGEGTESPEISEIGEVNAALFKPEEIIN